MRFKNFFILLTFSNSLLSQKITFDSASIVSNISYSKKLDFIEYKTNELEFYTLNAIKPFFEKLKKSANQQVRVLHIGDSHVQYDRGAGEMRNSFQALFGFSGRGFIFPYAAGGTHAAYDYKTTATGKWYSSRNISKEINYPLGVSGITINTKDTTAGFLIQFYNSSVERNAVDKLNVFAKTSDSSFHLKYRLSPTSDWTLISLSAIPFSQNFVEVMLNEKFDKYIEFKVLKNDSIQRNLELYGIQLVSSKNQGILYNSVGINGASLQSFMKQDLFVDQLKYVKPDLVILDYGTNDLAGGKFDSMYFDRNLGQSIRRIRSVIPDVCILIPSIQDFSVNGRNIAITSKYSEFVREFVKKNNLIFYDYYWISGARKSMKKWYNSGIAKSDFVHLTEDGYFLKGQLYGNAILNSFARYLSNPKDSVIYDRKIIAPPIKDTLAISDSSHMNLKNEPSEIVKKEKKIEIKKAEPPKDKKKIPSSKMYIVKKGDTLSKIATRYKTSVSQLKKINKLTSDKLQIGQKLKLP